MKYTTLPNTKIEVSKICLGTMTWGEQNTEAEGHDQMDYAVEQGINFFDTAELYSVPARAETYGATEKIIGTWFKKTGKREEIILASKIAGPGPYTSHIRTTGFTPESLHDAVNGSLERLQTDYIDLYQIHWPDRNTNFFGKRGHVHDENEQWEDNINQILSTLDEIIKSGKVRRIGLSNETPWGIMRYLQESKIHNLPKISTVQNPYSLLNRAYEVGNAEVSMRENVGLLPYSPLASGTLSGKYIGGKKPEGARGTLFPNFVLRYGSDPSKEAIRLYAELASKHGLSLAQMSLAYINTRPFVTSNIIGATTLDQLKENIDSINVDLSDDVLKGIEAIHSQIPDPAP
ncbi:NADP(H)-dependent aldo-keto reductase [Spongiivirga citrea]|uniref:Protein tas n=1 Tax=Spongiivirga citrea TaxID=1481457 RepID=A0A6M0CJD4_9FLAO|nr:NADP(H)-dependent aldo-keto reductase [Spongiivirga citrea]NER17093.1 NADP(H)-dependent aldo-keto reductase [Spongiivirga citrea]